MLMNYFDLESQIVDESELIQEKIILTYVKKKILSYGICSSKIYDAVVKNVISKNGVVNFENFLDYFNPVFKASEDYQSYKYKYLLGLSRNEFSNKIKKENFGMFLNLVKGQMIYDIETYSDLVKRLKYIFREKYPKENSKELNFCHFYTIVEFLVDLNYGN